jgi:D-glycerate 3-kinase
MLKNFLELHKLPETFTETAEAYYQPFADKIFELSSQQNKPYFIGINGCQGSGKSTLTDYLLAYFTSQYQLNVIVMSLDDFYYSSKKRQQLASDIHPLFATRGVPGTHDITQLKETLSKLKNHEVGFSIPKFNKATDDPFAETEWALIDKPVDIVLLEGWCWGVKPQSEDQLIEPINELELKEDPHGIWRNYVNRQLINVYQPLYQEMDFWLALQAPSFDCVYKWRLEQEQKLALKNKGLKNSKIMTPAEILTFTQYFQRLSVQGCKTISHSADATFYLKNDRSINETNFMEPA